MNEILATFGVAGVIIWSLLMLVIAILYLFLPFAIFGTKPLIRHQNELLAKQNKILLAMLKDKESETPSDE